LNIYFTISHDCAGPDDRPSSPEVKELSLPNLQLKPVTWLKPWIFPRTNPGPWRSGMNTRLFQTDEGISVIDTNGRLADKKGPKWSSSTRLPFLKYGSAGQENHCHFPICA